MCPTVFHELSLGPDARRTTSVADGPPFAPISRERHGSHPLRHADRASPRDGSALFCEAGCRWCDVDRMKVEDLMLFAQPRAVTVDYTSDEIDGTSHRGTFVLLDAGDAWLDDRDDPRPPAGAELLVGGG